MSTRKRSGCQPVRLDDGCLVLVNMRPGAELTKEDIAALSEFHRLLHEKALSEEEE